MAGKALWWRFVACALCMLAIVPAAVHAAAYPDRPIRMLIPQPAGGTMDSNARALVEPLSRLLNQTIVIDNRSGANGMIAGELLAKSAPDGYTLLYTSNSLLYNQLINKHVPFDALRDFVAVTQVAKTFGYIILVNSQVPAKSLAELVELSKRAPINYASGGVGNAQHFLGELVNMRTGAKMTHVPYKGLAPLITATIANEVQVAFAAPTTVVQYIKAGRLRALAYTADKRWSGLPDLPTVVELGMPDLLYEPGGHGLYAPAGTPAAIVNRIQTEVAAACRQPKLVDYFARGGYNCVGNTPEEFARLLGADLKRIAEIARAAHIEAQ
jgi:tripartite-type tricarboxylate transporter receptor subunit TctC